MPAPLPSAVASFIPKMGFQIRRRIAPLAGVLLLSLIAARAALATNGTWSDTTSGGLWSTTTNWSGGVVANGTDAIADFSTLNITADDTVHLDTARTIGQLKFGDTTPSNNWILDNNGVATNVLTLAVSSGSPTITVNNDTATMDLVLAGTQGFAKAGAGELLLNDADTFTGSVAINAGTLALGNSGALGSPSNAVSVLAGATLDLGGQTIGANPMVISGTGVGGNGALINSSASPASFSGTITANGPFTVGGTGDITLSGSVNGGNQVLTKIGNNTLTLSGTTDNSSLAVTVNSGTVVLAKTSSGFPNDVHAIGQDVLTVNGGTAQLGGTGGDQIYDLGSVVVTSGSFDTNGRSETFATLNLQGTGIGGAGALVNSAAAASTITPTNGTVLTGNASIGVSSGSSLTLNNAVSGNFALTKVGPGALSLNGTNSFSGGLTIQQGLILVPTFNNAGANGPLGNNTFVTLGASGQTGTIDFQGNNASSNMPFVLAAGGTGDFEQVIVASTLTLSGVISGSGGLAVDASETTSTLSLTANNTFTGGVTIGDCGLRIGNPGALNSSTPNSVTFGSNTFGNLSLNGNSVTVSGLMTDAMLPGNPAVQDANALSAVLTVNNSGPNTFAGTLQDGAGGGSLGLTKSGSGTLTLSGNNTFTGGLTVNSGTLALGSASALGSTANNVSVSNGATLDLAGQTIGANPLTLSGAGVGGNGALINSSANAAASYGGSVTLNIPTSIGGNDQITLSGTVAANTLTKIGSNTLILSGTTDNTNLGVVVNAGTVILAKTSSSSPDIHAVGGLGLTVNGGIAQLGGTGGDQIYDLGNVTVTSGAFDTNGQSETFATLFLQGTGIFSAGALVNQLFPSSSTITPTNGTVLTGNASIGVTEDSFITLSNAVSGNFLLTKVGFGGLLLNGTNTFSGGLTVQSGTLEVPTINNAGTNGPLGNNTFVTLGSANQTGSVSLVNGNNGSTNMPFVLASGGIGAFGVGAQGQVLTLTGLISGSGGLMVGGLGTLSLNANNTFTGGVTIQSGTLQVGNPGALNSTTPNAVNISSGFGALNLNGNTITVSGLTGQSFNFSPVVQDANAISAVLTVNNSGPNTFAGTLQDGPGGGSLGLTKSGSGTLTLGGNNTFTGGVTINGGNLQVGNPGALNSSSPNSVTFGASSTGTLSLNGNSITIGDLFANILTPVIQNANNGTAATLTVNTAGIDEYGGTLQDGAGSAPLSLVKNGIGIINLVGSTLNFTGSATINAGDVDIPTGNSLTGGITINGSSILELAGGSGGVSPDVVTFGPGSTGTLSVGVSGTIGGLNTDAGMVGAPVVMSGAFSSTLTINNSTNNTYAGVMQDGAGTTLSLAKSGAGALTLSGNNTFTGTTTVNAGTLVLGNANALGGTAGGTIVASGATLDLGGQAVGGEPLTIVGSGVGGNGALVNGSASPASFAGTITESGPFTVGGAGDITLNGGAIIGNFTLTKIGAGTLTLQNVSNCPINVNAGTLALSGGTINGGVNNSADVVLNSGTFGGPALTNSGTFTYNGGTFNGRLINAGTAIFNADFTAGNGMENDANVSIPSGLTITLNGQGLDNEGTLTMAGGTLNLSTDASAANLNRGNFILSATVPFGLNGATLTNLGTLNVNGGLMSGAAGLLTNGPGGTVSGTGAITSPFSNSGGLLAVTNGTLNITQPFANSGAIQLSAVTATLSGGAINNTGTINGFGNVGNPITNSGTGTIEPLGGILYLGGALANQAGGTIRIGTGNKLLVIPGLATNGSLINLAGGTFDNGGQPLDNLGQISGYGIFATGGTGLDNNGSITFSGGVTTVNGPVANENGKTITIAYNQAVFTGMVTNNGGATFNVLNTTATFAGGFTNNGNSDFAKAGGGAVEIDEAPTLGNSSTLSVTSGTLRFNVISGTSTIGTGVTAVVSSGATLELAGSVSALANGPNRVDIVNNSTAPGILVTGTNQVVGAIDGSGVTQVNANSDLTANHIIQSALLIGGVAGNSGLVTIDASDASGNPLVQSSGLALASSLTPSGPFGAGGISSANLSTTATYSPAPTPISAGNSALIDNASSVPEPSTLLLALFAVLGVVTTRLARRRFRFQAV